MTVPARVLTPARDATLVPSEAGRSGPVYFGAGRRLFGWYHAAQFARRDCGVVFCNPLGYEELCAHRALRRWADAVADAGFPALRFDYDGTGNSAGSDTDPDRVSTWLANIEDAAAELRARSGVQHVVLHGVRLGGTLAAAAAGRARADALILFAAASTGRSYVREVLALGRFMRADSDSAAMTSAEDADEQVAGFVMTRQTIADLARLDATTALTRVRRAFVVPRDDTGADTALVERLTQRGVDVERAALPGYAAMMVDAHESIPPAAVIDESIRWLTSHYAVSAVEALESDASDCGLVSGPDENEIVESAATFGVNRLFGVLCESSAVRCGTGVVLVNAGSVHTVGPGRAYVELAREWAARGIAVLRMDVGGVGDSDARFGAVDNHPYPDHAVEDVAAAVRWMIDRVRVSRVVVAGLCSGAHASFHAGLEVDGLAGIMAINPIVFYWNPACALDVSSWMNYYESRRYSEAARDVASWVKLVRGQVNVRHAASVVYRRMREVAGAMATTLWQRLGGRGRGRENVADDLARIGDRGVDVLLVFSEGDPGLDVVRRRYARALRRLEQRSANFAFRVIPDADHTFTRRAARRRLAELLSSHLISRHPA
jgi:dienelactone hydrolase